MGVLVCPRCGYENKENALYCNLCQHIFRYEGKRRIPRKITRRRNFYEEVASNKRKSYLLMMIFSFLLVVLGYLVGQVWGLGYYGVVIAGVIAVIMILISYYKGSEVVLSLSRAKRVYYEDDPRLFNVVEEMKIAAGLPTLPRIYIIEDTAPNAFATGRDPFNASVVVTRGLLQKLNREELQGVIAHEISHIKNYDIRFAMVAGVLLGIVAMISDAFLRTMFYSGGRRRRRSSSGGKGGAIILILAIVAAILAPLFAKMLQMAISRKREFLADASAVELTRNPKGLARALRKIEYDHEPLEVANRATQHLYIVNPVSKIGMKAKSLFSTHPPTLARIKVLESMVI
jgi:heat shock protein HtpX